MDFAKLKANAGLKSLTKLAEEVKKLDSNEKKSDERFWKPAVDKAGNGYAVIRFLPPHKDEDIPYVRMFDHGFKGPGGWYIENSLTTLGQPDPVSEFNSKLWNSTEDDKSPERKQVRDQKRRLHYISNIYVVTDPANPQNEGKVFLFKYGKKLFQKVKEAIEPPFDEKGRTKDNPAYDPQNAFNPFCFWTGANFELKIRKWEGYQNYDQSGFKAPGPLADDEELAKIHAQEYKLLDFHKPENFKSYDELKARLLKVLGKEETPARKVKQAEDEGLPWAEEKAPVAPKAKPAPAIAESGDDDDDDSLDYFRSLAQ